MVVVVIFLVFAMIIFLLVVMIFAIFLMIVAMIHVIGESRVESDSHKGTQDQGSDCLFFHDSNCEGRIAERKP